MQALRTIIDAARLATVIDLPKSFLGQEVEVIVLPQQETKTTPKRKKKPGSSRPENPSPSGDPWFDDPKNLAIVREAIKKSNQGKDVVLKSKEDIKKHFSNQ